jgi:hypothetical protein
MALSKLRAPRLIGTLLEMMDQAALAMKFRFGRTPRSILAIEIAAIFGFVLPKHLDINLR